MLPLSLAWLKGWFESLSRLRRNYENRGDTIPIKQRKRHAFAKLSQARTMKLCAFLMPSKEDRQVYFYEHEIKVKQSCEPRNCTISR